MQVGTESTLYTIFFFREEYTYSLCYLYLYKINVVEYWTTLSSYFSMLRIFCLQAIDTYCPQWVGIYKEYTSKEGVEKLFQVQKEAPLGKGEWLLPLRIQLEFYTLAVPLAIQHLLFLSLWSSILALCSRLCHFSEIVSYSPLPLIGLPSITMQGGVWSQTSPKRLNWFT